MTKTYLAYGSNLNLEQMADRCPTAKVLGAADLKDYHLVFRGPHGGAVATIEPLEGGSVPCLLWEITAKDEEALDRYEGFPYLYRKEIVRVKLGKKNVKAMVYIMNDGHPKNLPSKYYYSTILDGYTSSDLDMEALKQALSECDEDK